MFGSTSRYAALPDMSYEDADGRVHTYKARRFPPIAAPIATSRVAVRGGERLDNVAARALGDPLAFWRIADANGAMDPFDLAMPGARLLIPSIAFDGKTKP